jgi:hypothetical protein
MTYDDLRRWVVTRSLGCAALSFVIFLFAPLILQLFAITMRWDQAWKLAQISVPVLLGYVSSAVVFALGQANSPVDESKSPSQLLITLTKSAFYVYAALFVLVLLAYGLSNRPTGPQGEGMSSEMLATLLTGALAFLTATTNALVLILFGKAR